jgi:hypothetical protein
MEQYTLIVFKTKEKLSICILFVHKLCLARTLHIFKENLMSKVLKMTNLSLVLFAFMLASVSLTANAMGKQQAIQECVPTGGLAVEHAELCKSSGWQGDACAGKKEALKKCVKPKMMGG